jgi:hypothetical protein
LARAGQRVIAADRDPLVASCARRNLEANGVQGLVLVADAIHSSVSADLLVLDPDRRAGGARSLAPGRWSPPLGQALAVAGRFRGACIKLAPALDIEGLLPLLACGPAPGRPAHLQWTSSEGELRELSLWMGTLAPEATEAPEEGPTREVVVLGAARERPDGRVPAIRFRGRPRAVVSVPLERVSGIAWFAEPDPAVLRSGLLGTLARRLNMAPLGPGIAYLGGPQPTRSPLVRCRRVLGTAPADPRQVRALLEAHDVGPVTVMKRGHPDPTEVLAQRFRGRGSRRGLLAVTRLERGHLALLLETEPLAQS